MAFTERRAPVVSFTVVVWHVICAYTRPWAKRTSERQRKVGKRKKFVPGGRSMVKKKREGWGWGSEDFALPTPHTPTVHSHSKSNMTGRINDCELITLARPDKTPALQATRGLSLIIGAGPPANYCPTRLKSLRGRKNVRPAALIMRAWSQAINYLCCLSSFLNYAI